MYLQQQFVYMLACKPKSNSQFRFNNALTSLYMSDLYFLYLLPLKHGWEMPSLIKSQNCIYVQNLYRCNTI